MRKRKKPYKLDFQSDLPKPEKFCFMFKNLSFSAYAEPPKDVQETSGKILLSELSKQSIYDEVERLCYKHLMMHRF